MSRFSQFAKHARETHEHFFGFDVNYQPSVGTAQKIPATKHTGSVSDQRTSYGLDWLHDTTIYIDKARLSNVDRSAVITVGAGRYTIKSIGDDPSGRWALHLQVIAVEERSRPNYRDRR